jgi:hypothetical protein
MAITHDRLVLLMPTLPTDYTGYGVGTVNREAIWARGDDAPDCSMGCAWYLPVQGRLATDWGVCCSFSSPRKGFLTFEHQAGYGCFIRKPHSLKKEGNPRPPTAPGVRPAGTSERKTL